MGPVVPRSLLPIVLAPASLALVMAGCDDRAPAPSGAPAPPGAPGPARGGGAAPAAGSAASPPTASPGPAAPTTALVEQPAYTPRPGPAYLGVRGVGLLRLEVDGTLTRVLEHRFPFHDIVVDDGGVVYASAIGGMWRLEGGRKNRIDLDGMPHVHLALGPDGVLWSTDRRAVYRWDGAWSHEPAETFDRGLIGGLAVDPLGRVWVITLHALWRLDGDRWSRLDASFTGGHEPFFSAITVARDGGVLVSGLHGTFVHRDGRWTPSPMDSARRLDELVAGPAGHLAGSGGVGALAVAAPGEVLWRGELADSGARARRAAVRAVDGAGRLWLTTDHGLVVLDARGDLVQHWEPGTIAGVTGEVAAVAVVDDGPALPSPRPAVTGAVTGRVLKAGKPAAGAAIELCASPMLVYEHSPCEIATFVRTATTRGDGGFRVDDVPVGSFGVAARPAASRWHIPLQLDCCEQLEARGGVDVGVIVVP